MKVAVIILAAGLSSRFAQEKMYCMISGEPLLVKSLRNYMDFDERIEDIIIAYRLDQGDKVRSLVEQHFPDNSKNVHYVQGGLSRSESCRNCLREYKRLSLHCDLIAISDAARCYTSSDLVSRLFESAQAAGNAIPAIRRAETFKIIEDGFIKKTLKNNSLYEIQTPQVFLSEKIIEAYEKGFDNKRWANDDGDVYFSYFTDEKINIVDGDVSNIKITFPEDIR